MGESANDSRDPLFCSGEEPKVPCLHSQSVPGKPEDLAAEPTAPEPVTQGPGTLVLTMPATMASTATTTTTITRGVSMECALAVLSTRLGQQGEERATDRCHIEELSQQLNETSDQLAYIRKVLDSLVSGQVLAVVTAASSTASGPAHSSGSGCLPLGQATSFPQPSTASGSMNPLLVVITSAGMLPQPAAQVSFRQAGTFRIMFKLWPSWAMPMTPQSLTPLGHSFPWTSYHGFHQGWALLPWARLRAFTSINNHRQLPMLDCLGLPSTAPWTTPFTTELG